VGLIDSLLDFAKIEADSWRWAIEVFFNVRGNVGFSAAVFRQPPHQLNELLGGGTGLRLWQCRAQFRHYFITYCDLNLRASVLSHMAHQLGQSLACFANRKLHDPEVYGGVQSESTGGAHYWRQIGRLVF
jgi:hypothetical protein